RRVLIKAIEKENPKILLDLLKPGSIDLKKGVYYQPSTEDISFVGYWGMNVQLGDLYNIVKLAKTKSKSVILSGYSLGVLYVTNFLGNDFDNSDNMEAGFSLVDKAILFDGPPSVDAYVKTESCYKNGVTIIPNNFIDGKDKLESGKYYPSNGDGSRIMDVFFKMDLKAILAGYIPDELSPENYKINLKSYKITNYAKYLIDIDDNYAFFKLFTATLGRADAKHLGKFSYYDTLEINGLSDGKDRIEWIDQNNFETIEFNNPKDYINTATNKMFNLSEWYQPTRILLDFGSVHFNDTSKGWQKKYFNITQTKNITIPILSVGLARGLVQKEAIFSGYRERTSSKDFTIIMVDRITHVDGNTMTDNNTRQFFADITANWLLTRNSIY
ncbi:MAG TPA: hypothetical protein PK771_01325, partial [Spirochaetota bacterium]|nr:hypothetical protein [Spirochaetota bacterium]